MTQSSRWRTAMWNRTFLRFTLIEWLVAVVLMLIAARFFFAKELLEFESDLFAFIALGSGGKYLITVPLAAWVMFRLFKRQQAAAEEKGTRVVRPQVLVVGIGIVLLAIAAVVLTAP